MTIAELNQKLFELFSNSFEIGEDNDGQVVIYTGMYAVLGTDASESELRPLE